MRQHQALDSKFFVNYVGMSMLAVFVFYVSLFLLSMIFGFEGGESPGLLVMSVFALFMGFATVGLLSWRKPSTRLQAHTYAATWTFTIIAITLAITIANETTAVVFGHWFDYIVYVAMLLAPLLIRIEKESSPQSSTR